MKKIISELHLREERSLIELYTMIGVRMVNYSYAQPTSLDVVQSTYLAQHEITIFMTNSEVYKKDGDHSQD